MNTQTQDLNEIDTLPVDPSWRVAEIDNSPDYQFRAMFRPKLQEFLDLTPRNNGSYILAERQTKEWFLENYGIPLNAWHYRNRREKLIEE